MAYDPNQAHPKIVYDGTYPNLHVTQRADGSQELRSLEPGKESFFNVQPTGNYTGHGQDGAEVSVTVGKKHAYNADGTSSTTDGHSDEKVSGTSRSTVSQGSHSETGGNKYDGTGGSSISGSNNSEVKHSSGDGFSSTEGNLVTDHEGSVNHNYTGDYVTQVTGHKADIVHGENSITVTGGNMDTSVESGKYKVESSSLIILKVGGSTITITPDNITLKAARIDLNP